MITQQERERIFALYWGCQSILNRTENVDSYWISNKDAYLWLTPLSEITDEHAIEVAKMVGKTGKDDYLIHCGKSWSKPINLTPIVVDFLRSKGYALPAFGHTVEELVSEGVFKLREPNKQ